MSVPRYPTTCRTVVEIFSPTGTGGSAQQCWFVAEFPNKEYVFTVIRIDNEVAEVLIGHFWKEILLIVSGMNN